jgi:DNA-binding response OmpR family regulator
VAKFKGRGFNGMTQEEKTTILIVEDTPETLELLRRIVEKEGYRTILANDGEKGVLYAQKYHPDLILLDRLLPKLPGLQVCKRLRQNEAVKNTPIIFLSVLDSEKDIVDGLKAGGDDYVTKPFSPDELMARIERVLYRYRRDMVKVR